MNRKKLTIIITAAVVVIAGAAVTVTLMMRPSYNDVVKGCEKALADQYKAGGKGKPTACDGVKEDDYDTLLANAVMGHLGWLDSNGNFDKNKALDSTAP